jgi:hypothetical protein
MKNYDKKQIYTNLSSNLIYIFTKSKVFYILILLSYYQIKININLVPFIYNIINKINIYLKKI